MKKIKKSEFELYIEENLSETDAALLDGYFSRLGRHIQLPLRQKLDMLGDFQKALLYYLQSGIKPEAAIKRLDPTNLGGFYARPPILWYPLDDAAKIYPLSMKRNQMAVFRLSVGLKEDVVPELLQIALTFTIKRFPSFATTVKNGFFWHYMDTTKRRFDVEPETDIPCRPLNVSRSASQTFRVIYYGKRVSVEFFHILTDGNGGMIFLKSLTAEYLRLQGITIPCSGDILDIGDTPSAEETANGFSQAEPSKKSSGFMDSPAVQMSGRLSSVKPCQVLHFEMGSTGLRAVARQKGASVTAFILALMFVAQKYATDELRGNIQIQVPVNMRKFYKSTTIRNFALYCNIKIPLNDIIGVDAILPEITRQLKEKTSKEMMNEMMNATVGLVRVLKYIPLFIKRPMARIIYGFLGDKVFSNTLSNLGVITLPEEMASHIEKFDFVLGTSVTNRASCGMISFGDTATLSVAKLTTDPSFEEKLLVLLHENRLDAAVKGSELYGN